MAENLYDILGVSKSSSDDEIKKAYRKLAQKYHPDKTKGDKDSEDKFKKINLAYEVLSDKQKRGQYDQFGAAGMGQGGHGHAGGGFNNMNFDSSNFADIFEEFFGFGGGGRSRGNRANAAFRGKDLEALLKLDFEESIFGTEKELEMSKMETCEDCDGKGHEKDSKIITCTDCNGQGQIRQMRRTVLGQIATQSTCPKCSGEGKTPEKICKGCRGAKRTKQTSKVTVKIPEGISDGDVIKVSGKGEAGLNGGPHGDVYLHVQISPHKLFVRDNMDIRSDQAISHLQAIMGADIKVDTVYGKADLTIPAGTQPGNELRIKEKGVFSRKSGRKGDHIVKLTVSIPKKLSKQEKDLYAQLYEQEKKGKKWF